MTKVKVVILAGGRGSRLAEMTSSVPKPMVEIGGRPIIWHIMKHFAFHGYCEFILCLGYKSHIIKDYFLKYNLFNSDIEVSLRDGEVKVTIPHNENWTVRLIETGELTETGGRLRKICHTLDQDVPFFFTYADGLSDINLKALYDFHLARDTLATVTAVSPPGRFGAIVLDYQDHVTQFREKPKGDGMIVNGGFFVLRKQVLDYISGDDCVWEREPLETLVQRRMLSAYRHNGFWHPMDTLRDKNMLEDLWASGSPPWKLWKD